MAILFVLLIALVVAFFWISAAITQFLWNALMPSIFSLPQITLFQGFLINICLGFIHVGYKKHTQLKK